MKTLATLLLIIPFTFGSCQDKYPELADGVYAEFNTNKGTFVAKLYADATPLTVANFIALAEGTNEMVDSTYAGKKFYNGLTFHRVMADFMIQGGDPLASGQGGPGYRFPDEFVDSLKHDGPGILSMANYGPGGTNGSQFFVTLVPTPWLDGRHSIFGEIVIGQDVVETIGVVETTKPGDKPVEDVIMNEVNIIRKGKLDLPSFVMQMEEIERENQEKQERLAKIAAATTATLQPLAEQSEELASGLRIYWNQRGRAMRPTEGSTVLVNCTGYFKNGDLFFTTHQSVAEKYEAFDPTNEYVPMEPKYSPDAALIPGFREALLMMSPGDKATVFIPSHLAYGAAGRAPVIPPNADLIFEIELAGVKQ